MKIFYSYSHKDEYPRDRIEKHLALLKDEGYVEEWYDRRILAGQEIHKEIDSHLETSDLILLLLSPDYFASLECKKEMRKALEQKEKNNTIVIPVIARPCAWKDLQTISDLRAMPKDGRPITKWHNEDDAFLDIYENIKAIVDEIPFRTKRAFMNDLIQVEFISQHKENVKLDDLFVFPNIRVEYGERQIGGFQDFWTKSKHVILKGDERSGKTVICRKLFLNEVQEGTPTILISGNDITSPINHEQLVERKFREQFNGSYSYWRNKQSKLLILDDFSHNTRLKFIDFAKEFFDRIIIVMSEDDYLAYFHDEESLADFELLTLRSLGHTKQEDLIKRWINLSDMQEVPHGMIDQIEDRLNSIILHNRIVPRYPFYILSILQTLEAFMPQSLQITAYGHCYQALITAQLISRGVQKENIDSSFNFLTHFAFEIFKGRDGCSQDQFEQFLENYEAQYIIKDSVVNRLVDSNSSIIRTINGKYQFYYPFIYYFFLGNFFARHYKEHQELIGKIAEKSYLQDNAYILIFTIHHTQDEDLIDTVLIHTADAFDYASAATLDISETKLLEGTLHELPEKILSNRSVKQERRLERQQRDKTEADIEDAVNDGKSEDENLNEMYKALKNMEILGQILRNKYGSLHREKIEEVIDFVTDAGLRLINVSTNRDSILGLEGYLIKVLKNEDIPEDDRQKIEKFLRKQIRTAVFLTIGSLLYKVVVSIRKPELKEIVESMYQPKDTPAHDLLHIFFLLESSEKLDSQSVRKIMDILNKLDKSQNIVAQRLLSFGLQYYANTHEIHFKYREKLFRALNLKYQPNPLKNPQLK